MDVWDSRMTHSLQLFGLSAAYVEITELGKLTTSSRDDYNYGDSTFMFRLETQGLSVPRIYGVNNSVAAVEGPRIFNCFT